MKRPAALALCLLALLVFAACAATSNPSSPPSSSPGVRCLSDPRETDMRPLVFLFCVENP